MRLRYLIPAFLLVAAVLAGVAVWTWAQNALVAPGPLTAEKILYVAPGTVKKVGAELQGDGVIADARIFRFGARLHREEGGIKAGEYAFPAKANTLDVIRILQADKVYQHHLTVAEGLTSAEITDVINDAPALTGKIETVPPEGSLLPETYNYTYDEKRETIVARMQKAMEETLQKLWAERTPGLMLQTPQEAVTLASIVEKETGIATERPRIAGVFMNRLKKGMPLQSDPTVIYALTEGKQRLDRPLLRTDLDVDSPYNTYVHAGLPPGPIANPGREALKAVLSPEANDFLYFVADGSGGHAFGKSLEEHMRNVAKWRAVEKKARH
ncbi:MAG: endolytic transglycosylase MltG [Alphaproteobacteria bacterium]|nr:endolytic transglycosylase MltG [Alphaproteobacteria bacterium]